MDLFRLINPADHSHGLSDAEWVSLFTEDKPIIFNFHSYPWLVHRLTYKRPGASKKPARARLQGEGQHRYAARAGHPQPD